MTYNQALDFLNSRIPVGWKLGLDTMRQMLAELENPHHHCKFVHIAGTNGKGSVASMLAAIFDQAGYKTGLYTSPHLVDVRERIQLNGVKIDKKSVARLTQVMQPSILKYNATYFEALTVLAFLFFAERKTDIVALETGLGGRLDATNVVTPELSIVTSIDFDHMEHLGTTLAEIAAEKAGIIKPGRPCLIGELAVEAEQTIRQIAEKNKSVVYKSTELCHYKICDEKIGQINFTLQNQIGGSEKFSLSMNGQFQVKNACMAISACDILNRSTFGIERSAIASGLRRVRWPGRFEIVHSHPMIILDVAHNPASMKQLVLLLQQFCSDKKIFFLIGVLKDKNYGEMAAQIAEIADTVQPVQVNSDRALPARELQKAFQCFTVNVLPPRTISDGLNFIYHLMDEDSVLCITGSHYVVGDAMLATKGLTK